MPTRIRHPHPEHVALTAAVLALPALDREALAAEARSVAGDDRPVAPFWQAVAHLLDMVSEADEQRLMVEATTHNVVAPETTAFALSRYVRPIARAALVMQPGTRLSLADAILNAVRGIEDDEHADHTDHQRGLMWRRLGLVVLLDEPAG